MKPLTWGVPKVLALPQPESSWARELTSVHLSTWVINRSWQGEAGKRKKPGCKLLRAGIVSCGKYLAGRSGHKKPFYVLLQSSGIKQSVTVVVDKERLQQCVWKDKLISSCISQS